MTASLLFKTVQSRCVCYSRCIAESRVATNFRFSDPIIHYNTDTITVPIIHYNTDTITDPIIHYNTDTITDPIIHYNTDTITVFLARALHFVSSDH